VDFPTPAQATIVTTLISLFAQARFRKATQQDPYEACRQGRIPLLQRIHCRSSGRCVGDLRSWAYSSFGRNLSGKQHQAAIGPFIKREAMLYVDEKIGKLLSDSSAQHRSPLFDLDCLESAFSATESTLGLAIAITHHHRKK
jgi:hypothetical protein